MNYTYDAAGRRNSITYPTVSAYYNGTTFTPMQSSTFTTTYDAMGRATQVTSSTGGLQAYSAQYDVAGRMTSVTDTVLNLTLGYPSVTRAMAYNVNGQLTSQSWTKYGGTVGGLGSLTYSYSATQNNGQITQITDGLSGETIVYQYDALKRLASAAATPTSGSTPAAWTQTYQYDGFGNLTAKVLNGATSSIPVDGATNRLSGGSYDNNGNWTSGGSYSYDGSNRLVSVNWPSNINFGYDPQNHRIFQGSGGNAIHPGTLTLYGAYGERLATYGFLGPYSDGTGGPIQYQTNVLNANVWFNGQIVSGHL